jgi:hypothetical protein
MIFVGGAGSLADVERLALVWPKPATEIQKLRTQMQRTVRFKNTVI